ncbi:ABC transporter ATP-binding protein [Candidatus Uhrbacteria bacterium CG10_big_fil_rev_8_21_14_0_10_48_11]|uniref:ABC transporter ATP-binding protein n=1 Tax=Candidatus Uhrbacteria bacterium CG10_big_fil_rev_8_21_14_0_10_48_11 TaxID=1975037 RepID=A0A2M8LEQ2_9BACT|nr:MAG: ABC transporter ATP-binding protein [Candidatus Uhrbacteria bacterium CG10_big_fil_rev_8_21_14_0_10_48_11]
MLHVENITKHFGGVVAVSGCSFHVKPGSVTALVGPNGAGKTTVLDMVSGLLPVDSGQVLLGERNLTNKQPYVIANAGLSRTFQQVRLFRNLTILDHLMMAKDNDDTRLLFNIWKRKKVEQDFFAAHLGRFKVTKPLSTVVADLSYGQRKLLQLAMATLKPHHLLLLDEPVAGVTALVQEEIETLLLEMRGKPTPGADAEETMLIVEHDMGFVRRLADQVMVMDAGRVLVSGTPEVVLSDPRVLEAYLGV